MIPDTEIVRAMLNQALAEARSRGANRITELHLVMYDSSREAEAVIRKTLDELSVDTPAENAQVITRPAPSRFICWNCCGLRFESDDPEAACPNCGRAGLLIPADVTFALDHIEVA
ncbi:MAG TPA: hydrogenase maturation nickel metallochaperone HypA [Anaerolineae bacterium]|nr:hydrogenase maturation nickel metallochaperone HypA [Anaerolineae bacterium]